MPRILILISLLAIADPGQAGVGLKAGPSWSDLRGDSITEPYVDGTYSVSAPDGRLGVAFGVTVTSPVWPWLDAAADVLYVQKGADYTGEFGGFMFPSSWAATLQLDYLEVPIFVRLREPSKAAVRPYIDLGFYAAMLLNARYATTDSQGIQIPSAHEFWSRVMDWDLGAVLGGGLEFTNGDRTWRLEMRYAPGLVHIEQWGDTIKNTSLTLTAVMSI